ncbi:MAG: hypothetical protein AVDCRST_MAG88-2833, partial [uncultured Thermomicrobiales bacterium]
VDRELGRYRGGYARTTSASASGVRGPLHLPGDPPAYRAGGAVRPRVVL